MNPYETLNIKTTATQKQINNAYRKLSKKYHPDKGGNVEEFLIIQKAYLFLSNPLWRAKYNETGIWNDPQIQGNTQTSSDKCLEILSGAIEGLLETDNTLESPIHEIRSAIKNIIKATEDGLFKLQNKLNKVSKILTGYNVKDEDILKILLDRKIILIEEEKKEGERIIEASNIILNMLKNYDDKIKHDDLTDRQRKQMDILGKLFPNSDITWSR